MTVLDGGGTVWTVRAKLTCKANLALVGSLAVELGAAVVHDGPPVVHHHPETKTNCCKDSWELFWIINR